MRRVVGCAIVMLVVVTACGDSVDESMTTDAPVVAVVTVGDPVEAAIQTACGASVTRSVEVFQEYLRDLQAPFSTDERVRIVRGIRDECPEALSATSGLPSAGNSSGSGSFGDGVWIVGRDIQPGTYRNSDSSQLCYWERLSGFSGELGDILANEVSDAIQTVTIKSTDAGFSATDCGVWTKVG